MLLNNIKFEVNITKLKYFLLLPFIFFSINLQSQAEASNWHFGYGAGLTFNLGDGTVTPNNDAQFTMNTNEGCSSISDFNGNLLFYTDGRNVWDRNHNVMPNADYNSNPDNGLLGDPSSTSSGLIIPKPGNPNQYYIFAVDEPHHQNAFAFPNQGPADEFGNPIFDYDSGGSIPGADDGFNNGLTYSLVDLELNSGNGDVVGTEKNIELITYDQSDQGESSYKCSEKITAIEHADGQSYWVLTQFVNNFYAFRVDETGVNPNPIITTIEPLISFQGYRRNGIGYMKASPNGEKIAVAHRQNGDESGGFSFNTGSVWLYDFDSATGELSNSINAYPNFGPYGVEFSPDSSKLYVTGDSSVIQFDLDAQDLVPFVVYNGFDFIGAIQLGPDGKIYVANSEDYNSLDVINSPNLNADDCEYVPYEIDLASNTFASIGLPPFIQSFFLASITAQNFCAGSVTTFSVNSNETFDNINWDFGDGIGTSNSENPSYVYVNPGEYTILATITAGSETIVFSEIIQINQTPTANAVEDLFECDDDNDGVLSFDFVESQNQVLAGQDSTAFSVTYHLSQEDADTNTNALAIPYSNTNTTEQIFVRIENNANTSCFDTTSFNLNVFDTPVANSVQTYEVCDDLNDGDDANGQTEVILTDFNNEVLNGQDADLFDITYHLSQEDADTNTNAIGSPYYNNGTPFSYQVFVRIENSLKVECYSTTEFTINIYTTPTANAVEDLFECDDDNDGVLSFDFVESQNQVLAGQDSTAFSVTYHLSQEDADTNTNALAIPYSNTNTTEQIFVRIENNANTSCFDTTSFNLNVFDTPVANSVQTYEVCDDLNDGDDANGQTEVILTDFNNEVLNGQDADLFDITYHLSQEDADTNTNAIGSPYYNNGTPFSYQVFVRIENSLKVECYSTTEFTINIYTTPTANAVEDLFECDDDNDGVLSFDFVESQNQVLAGQDSTAFSVTYHLSQEDADTNTNALAIPYSNTNTTEQIFVRIENNANTSCFDTTSFNLNVFDTPVANSVQTYEVCDDLNDGDDANGQTEVILTDFNNEVLNGQDADLFDITYHLSQEDADTNTNAIGSPYYNNGTPFSYQVFVRIENSLKVECYSTTEFTINIYTTPTANAVEDLFECDDDNDGVLSFDFVESQNQVLAGQDSTAFSVTYHLSQEDADTNTNALAIPYSNTNTTEQIFVRIENNANTSCFDTTSFNLNVFDTPVANSVQTYEVCDDLNDGDDANGQTEVILTDFNNEVLNGQDADLFDITYHLSQEDADTNTNAIGSPYYNNGTPFSYQVFVRIENSLKVECYSTTEFTINIYTTPTANAVEDLFECDDDNDGVLSFDFVESQNQVLAGQDSTAFSVTYHLSQEDADTNTNALAIPYSNTNTTEQIFVRIENNANTSCFDTTSFNLNVFDTPVGTTNIEYYQCDYNNPGDYTEVFDLSSLNSEIINGQNVTISHYETFNDAENESNPITGPYTNLSADQSIYYLLISNIYSECRFIGTYTIGVDPLPNVIENVPLVQCDIDGVQDGISIYNLEEAAENIVVGDDPENYSLTFHTSQEDLDANLNAITNPNSYVNLTPLQTIYTRVENINTTCYTTSYFYLETIFNPIPEDAGLIVCDNSEMNGNDYDGLGLFTLSDADDYILSMIVANPNNDITSPDQLTVKYYASENDALLELNQLPDQYISEVPNQQTLYIRVERENDCFGINSMLLQVFSVPEFNDIQDEILCTNTPGEAEVDLLDYNEIILGSQNENDIIISYHSSQEDADNGVNSLNSPYTVVDQQTIYVREEIQNNDPDVTGCFITNVNFTLTVESIPDFFQPENPELCDDDYDGIQTFDLSELDQQVIGGQTDLTISYHVSIEDAIENINLLPIIFTNTIQDNQTIFIRIENNITGCYETGSTNLIVNPKPFINTLQPYEVCDDNVDLDGDSTNNSVEFDLLSQNSAVLGGQDPLLFNVTYYLTEEDALNSSNSLNSQYTNEINPQTIYTRLDNLVNGCFEVAPLTLKVNPLPVVFIDNEYLLCVNTNGTEIIPPLEIDTGLENSAYTFIWSNLNGEIVGTDSSFFPSQGGDYFLEVFDSTLDTQCAAPIETFTVFESSPPIVTAEVTTPAFASIHIIEAIATGSGVYEFSLDQGPWQDSGLFYDISPGEHTVTVRDINGCGESKETLYVIDYPRFFTPNGDGYNDLWNIKGISNQQEAKIYIFDRYGKLLKEIRPSGRGWDGTYNGNLMPTNDYWFTLYYKDPTTGENKQLSAHFTLKT
jgi:gliding motility-associated-like protein